MGTSITGEQHYKLGEILHHNRRSELVPRTSVQFTDVTFVFEDIHMTTLVKLMKIMSVDSFQIIACRWKKNTRVDLPVYSMDEDHKHASLSSLKGI